MSGSLRKAVLAALAAAALLCTPGLSAQESYQWQIRRDADGQEDSLPMVFRVRRTDPGSAANNVHQVELRFRPGAAQAGGGQGAGGLYFQVYVPNTDYSGYDTVTVSNPPMADDGNDAVFDWTLDQGGSNGYQIAMEKIDGAVEWLVELRFKPFTGNPNLFGVVGFGSHTATEVQFVVVARNVTLADPPAGGLLSAVDLLLGTRTRSEYNAGSALGATGLTFDAPPQVTITAPLLLPGGVKGYGVAPGAPTPYVDDEIFSASISNDDAALSAHRWLHDPPDDPAPTATVAYPIADPLANPTMTQTLDFDLLGLHLVWFEVQEAVFGSLTQTGRAYAFPVVKNPPAVSIACSPSVGDVPLDIALSVLDLQHNDPLVEPDPDANGADYTYEWKIKKEGVAAETVISTTSLSPPHQIPSSGVHRVTLTVTDDYNIPGSGFVDVYAAPIEKMVFPPHRGVPFDSDEPQIDGVVDYFDLDGDGVRDPVDDADADDDLFEHGWTGAYRLTYETGAYPSNIAFQGTRPRSSARQCLYLSFEVRDDPTFDDEDVIVLAFRRDADSTDPRDDRKIFVFPVYRDSGAGNDGNQNAGKYDRAPRLVQYWKKDAGGQWVTAAAVSAATPTNPDGFAFKVSSKSVGSSRYWDLEMQVPTSVAAGGGDWIDFDQDFLFYFDVIRIDRTVAADADGYAVQSTWPRRMPKDYLAANVLEDYPFPAAVWGRSFRSTTDQCRGVSLEAWSDIGVDSNPDPGVTELSHLMQLPPQVNRFVALLSNSSEEVMESPPGSGIHVVQPVAAEGVRARFSIAHWGIVGQDGDWREIGTTPFETVPAQAGDPLPKHELDLDWEVPPAEVAHYTANEHQCIKVELDSNQDTNILVKGVARNMDFAVNPPAFSRRALISTIGFGPPPEGRPAHRVLLKVSRSESRYAGEKTRDARLSSTLHYVVNGYLDSGRVLVINGKRFRILEPMGSFGYVLKHSGDMLCWKDEIPEAEKISKNSYVLDIPADSQAYVTTRLKAVEPTGLSLSLHAGAATPLEPSSFASDYRTGWCAIADLGFRIRDRLALAGLIGYNRFPARSSGIEDAAVLNVALNARYFLPLRPDMEIGIGAGPELFVRDFSSLEFGYDLDLGYLWRLSRRLLLELGVTYHSHFDQQVWFLQTRGGLVFSF